MSAPGRKLKIGVLGAAKIAPMALIEPARSFSDVQVAAVAARDEMRAGQFAARHAIPQRFASYGALVADPHLDAIYNPLPNGLHGRWTAAAIEAGKHVLCEKPFAANASEAEHVAKLAHGQGLVVMEAFHYRYHALTRRIQEIMASGELGVIRHIEAWFCIPMLFANIRWELPLAGGTLMDVGCYTIHLLRTLTGSEPIVRSAVAKLRSAGIDRWVRAELEFPGCAGAPPVTGAITASMLSWRLFSAGARITGSEGTLLVSNPYAPQYFHRLTLKTRQGHRKERVAKQPSSYAAQLRVFADAVLYGKPYPTDTADAVANMKVIDACYAAAGLPRREPSAG